MNFFKRIKNAFLTDGIKEVFRKGFYHFIYVYNGKKIIKKLEKKQCDFALYQGNDRKEKIIVSLTTYPKRFNTLHICLKSLSTQTIKPDKIIVYLGSDSENVDLPNDVEIYKKYGIEFKVDKSKNLRSHKKYYYAVREFPDDIVVTADDDVVYPDNWLETLMKSYRKYPDAISARRVHMIKKDTDGNLKPYNLWIDQCRSETEPTHKLIATGNSGVLYPPHCLDERVMDYETFCEICYEADDIWLKCMALLKNTKVVWVPNYEVDLPEIKLCDESLSNTNVWNNMNDVYLKKVMNRYGLVAKDFFDKV